ncbi:MAG: 23S rRNA (guanosine(2251)-2'-O)-methyltransferase RlmB [Devosia sp.]
MIVNEAEPYWLYGLHAVSAALANPRRAVHRFVVGRNALRRLEPLAERKGLPAPEMLDVKAISGLVPDAVHQGAALLVDPLEAPRVDTLGKAKLVLCLDQVTDPHNVGAILRSAAAFGADAVIAPARNSASETGVLAKAASGALEIVPFITVTNLSRTVDQLRGIGFMVTALDSAADAALEDGPEAGQLAFVLGAEGKGVRPGVMANCDRTAAIHTAGDLHSLNVSNAAAICLYVAASRLAKVPAADTGSNTAPAML